MAIENESETLYEGTGDHTPVTNQPVEATQILKNREEAPSEGNGAPVNPLTAEGIESVPGFKKTELAEAAAQDLFFPPETGGLRDIGEASFGAPAAHAEIVHGVDDRVRVMDTKAYPFRVECSLLITAADNSSWSGTAWFISPRTLITAGHCVHIKGSPIPGRNGWVKDIRVMPGRDGDSLPFGSVTSTVFRSASGWTEAGDANFDYGAIILSTPLGDTVGWLGLGSYTDQDLITTTGNISGYPSDKQKGTQWFHANRIAGVDGHKVFYDIDTVGGQSGAAVYRAIGDKRYAFGVHAYGGASTNSGTRITPDVLNNMISWKL